jgi:hypothetical protein
MDDSDHINGRVGRALDFDGNNDYAYITPAATLNPTTGMSIAAWIYVKGGNGTNREIMSKWQGQVGRSENCYLLGINTSNKVRFSISGDGTTGNAVTIADPNDVPSNVWTHYEGTWNGTTMTLYRNGVQVATGSQSSIYSSTSIWAAIGADMGYLDDGTQYYFNGDIDDLRFYNYGRTADEVKMDYNNGAASFK